VTVVIAARNAAPFISDALRSVCHQTYPPEHIDIIVVDDGSTDQTAAAAHAVVERERRTVLVLQLPRTCGPSAARNRGWQAARGDWIQFLDADDVISERKIEVQARAAADTRLEVACVYSRWARIAHVGAPVVPEDVFDPDLGADPASATLRAENFLPFGAMLVRRSWLAAVNGFNEAYRLVEDVDLQLRIFLSGGRSLRAPTSRPLFWYRKRPGSLSQENDRAFVEACVRNIDMVAAHWSSRDLFDDERREAVVGAYYWAARFFAEHDPDGFRETLDKIQGVLPEWEPPAPLSVKHLSRLVGYAAAERLAVKYRRLMRLGKTAGL
jgi:glycosyltransferase involved in cell wall biosynthesis